MPFNADHYRDVDEDARRDAIDDRRREASANHSCGNCDGHTGPGSPCELEATPEPDDLEDEHA